MEAENATLAGAASVARLFRSRAVSAPDAPALTGARTWSYGQLCERVQRVAGVLAAAGVGEGDRVAVLSRNRSEYLEGMLACAWLGAVVACQNWRLAEEQLSHCLDLVEPRLLLASPEQAERLAGRAEPLCVFGEIRFAATLEFLALVDDGLPQWAAAYRDRVEEALGVAYSEPAADVRGFVAQAV